MKLCKSLSHLDGREEAWPGHPLILHGIFRAPHSGFVPEFQFCLLWNSTLPQVLTTQVFLSAAQELDSSCLCPIPHPPTPELYLITSALLLNSSFLFWFLCVKFRCKFKEEVAWDKESHSVAKMYLKDHFLLKVFLLTYLRVNSSSLISHSTLIINNIPFFLLYMKQCIFTLYL